MRNHKFRAWHPNYQLLFNFELKDVFSYFEDAQITKKQEEWQFANKFYLRDLIIMQYLGEDCKDYKGTELCENDLVKFRDEESLGKIAFFSGAFIVQDIITHINWPVVLWEDYTKFGNIYQNPELLKA